MGRHRDKKHQHWPRGLREPRTGYFTFERAGHQLLVIGRVSEAEAIRQVYEAWAYLSEQEKTLVQKLKSDGRTIGALLDKMPVSLVDNTAKTVKSQDKHIREALGDIMAVDLTVAHCADLIATFVDAEQGRTAQAVRSRLSMVCQEGMALGWMDKNPAAATRNPKYTVQRARLTLEMWQRIYEVAPKVNEWLQNAMRVAIVTGADRSTISAMTRSDIKRDTEEPSLLIRRSKTAKKSAGQLVPLRLRLDVLGLTLADVLGYKSGVVSRYIVHHETPSGIARRGDKVHVNSLSKEFTKARILAGVPDEIDGKTAPTFYEQRSLAARLYTEQGNVNVQALLGHASAAMTAVYQDGRGMAPVVVKVG